ncbi:MAG: hypothetical protein WKF70_10230, partial [Chitinophagaceae bacterium]
MKIYNQPVELIIDSPAIQSKSRTSPDLKKSLRDAGIPVEAISSKYATFPRRRGLAAKSLQAQPTQKVYVTTGIRDTEENPWD